MERLREFKRRMHRAHERVMYSRWTTVVIVVAFVVLVVWAVRM